MSGTRNFRIPTKAVAVALLALGLSLMCACPFFKRMATNRVGKDGWELAAGSSKAKFNLVRSIHHSVWIMPMPNTENRIMWIRITPQDLPFEIPPFVKFDHKDREGFIGSVIYENRYFRINEGYAFDDVYRWYMKTFGFE